MITGIKAMTLSILLLSGLVLLIVGARFTVSSASTLAHRFGVSPLVVGITLVAFGTGVPELALNVLSAWNGATSLAFGNLAGASTLNITLVLGITAMIQPLTVKRSVVTREIPLMILASFALLALSADSILGHYPVNLLDMADGLVLLLFFSVFLYYTIFELVTQPDEDAFVQSVKESCSGDKAPEGSLQLVIITLVVGIMAVVLGGRMTLSAAVDIARVAGVSEGIIGLTLISFGTTLPELLTCITAARKGQHDLALGNLIGSNILNMLFFFGIVSMVHPIPLPEYGLFDLLMLSGICIALAPIALRGPLKISRGEGLALTIAYVVGISVRLVLLS